MPLSSHALVDGYLATLGQASEATRRQRRWALADLLEFAATPSPPPSALLAPEALSRWLLERAYAKKGASLPSQRARASAARALADYAVERGELSKADARAARTALELPAPPLSTESAEYRTIRRLLAASRQDAPPGLTYDGWDRFGAHLHLLAQTGLPERDLSQLNVDAVAGTDTIEAAGRTWTLSRQTTTVVATWLETRARIVENLQGSDPGSLWLRVAPAGRADGTLAPAGLPISQRGLRLAFAAAVTAARARDEELTPVDIAAVRRWAARAHPGDRPEST